MANFNLTPREQIVWAVIDEYTNLLPNKYQVFEPKEILNYKGDYLRKALNVAHHANPDKGVRDVIRDLATAGKPLRKLDVGKFQVIRSD